LTCVLYTIVIPIVVLVENILLFSVFFCIGRVRLGPKNSLNNNNSCLMSIAGSAYLIVHIYIYIYYCYFHYLYWIMYFVGQSITNRLYFCHVDLSSISPSHVACDIGQRPRECVLRDDPIVEVLFV